MGVRKSADASPISELAQLEGRWVRQEDMVTLGEVKSGEMLWEEELCRPPSPLCPRQEGCRLVMDIDGKRHEGVAVVKPPLTVTWADGEVWSRADAAPQRCDCKRPRGSRPSPDSYA